MSKKKIHGVWNNIASTKNDNELKGFCFGDIFRQKIKFRGNKKFQNDLQIVSMKLKYLYPSLYELESHKSCPVNAIIHESSNKWRQKSCPTIAWLSSDLEHLSKEIAPTRLQSSMDFLSGCPNLNGIYKVASLRVKLN